MTIEAEIMEWALERPAWQQEVLVALANGEQFDATRIVALANRVLASNGEKSQAAKGISLKPNAPQQVQLKEITGIHGVNALADGQSLTFAPSGMTVIYGDNGSGKSGYARLIKGLVSARHATSILPDVFRDNPADPSAELTYTVDGQEATVVYPNSAPAELLKMSFYDEHCGTEYLTKQSTITYRPSALFLFDGLIQVCDLVRNELQDRVRTAHARALSLNLSPQTTAGAFLVSLTDKTTDVQIEQATRLAPDAEQVLASTLSEIARMTTSDPIKERTRLYALEQQLNSLAQNLTILLEKLGLTETTRLAELKRNSLGLRAAARLAASKSFESEPVTGVGSTAWRALWSAAREYSLNDAYHNHRFPVTDEEARCIFCQQPLGDDAKQRLKRFDSYMADTTEQQALVAEQQYGRSLQIIETLSIATPSTLQAVAGLTTEDANLGNAVQALLDKLEEQRTGLLAHLHNNEEAPAPLPDMSIPGKVALLAGTLKARADKTDTTKFEADREALSNKRDELQAAIRLSDAADQLRAEVKRLNELARLQSARVATDTTAITQKSSALTRKYSTTLILDQFTLETDRLKLERVTLEDMGGQKGQLNQKPGLLGAKHPAASARIVLSEGEQTALGLAGFFTEATLDESKSTIIFDDPVSSLDHIRRENVAIRLAQLSAERQVIVFSHDVSFVGDLEHAAESTGVEIASRSIERRGSTPGTCLTIFPWKAKDFKARVDTMKTALAIIKRDRSTLSQSDYEERVASWSGQLSETWERSVSTEIINQVYERGKGEVRPRMFKLFAKITDDDNKDFQEGYGHTSKWARRHDKAPETNYVAPEPDEMEAELQRIVDWQKRIKQYQN